MSEAVFAVFEVAGAGLSTGRYWLLPLKCVWARGDMTVRDNTHYR